MQKWMALAGLASRRKAEAYIAAGRVTVNGIVVTALGAKAETTADTVCLDGQPVLLQDEKAYIMLHKPTGVITTAADPQGRRTVVDMVPSKLRLFPVGRLDYDSSGLLLLTNDGDFAYCLTHPSHAVTKEYVARLRGTPAEAALECFRAGLVIDGHMTAPCDIQVIPSAEHNAWVRIMLKEGRNRQIRKMCDVIGHPVLSLKRVAVGAVQLGSLPKGQWRHLTPAEVAALR